MIPILHDSDLPCLATQTGFKSSRTAASEWPSGTLLPLLVFKFTVLKPENKTKHSRDFQEKPGNLAVLFVRALDFGC
jgi:hypothetical protein